MHIYIYRYVCACIDTTSMYLTYVILYMILCYTTSSQTLMTAICGSPAGRIFVSLSPALENQSTCLNQALKCSSSTLQVVCSFASQSYNLAILEKIALHTGFFPQSQDQLKTPLLNNYEESARSAALNTPTNCPASSTASFQKTGATKNQFFAHLVNMPR